MNLLSMYLLQTWPKHSPASRVIAFFQRPKKLAA
jgi:hypothetical protein